MRLRPGVALSVAAAVAVVAAAPVASAPAPPLPGPLVGQQYGSSLAFWRSGQQRHRIVRLHPRANTVQLTLTWPRGGAFDARRFRTSAVLFADDEGGVNAPPGILAFARWRSGKSLDVRITRLRPRAEHAYLSFSVVARKVPRPLRVRLQIRQSRFG